MQRTFHSTSIARTAFGLLRQFFLRRGRFSWRAFVCERPDIRQWTAHACCALEVAMRTQGIAHRSMYSIAAALLICTFGMAGHCNAYKEPDTGQTKCYSAEGVEIICSGSGQDGDIITNPMNYTDNGNATVTDNNTGLTWQKETGDTQYNWYQASGTYHATHNPTTYNYCASLSTGGHADWRLPSQHELMTLVDYSFAQPGPTITTAHFPTAKTFNYWSASTLLGYSDGAWYIGFSFGDSLNGIRTHGAYVRCVRGGVTGRNFTDNLNGTVTDSKTSLMWQQGEQAAMTWSDALSFCNNLVLPLANGYTDWRLPDIKELHSLVDNSLYYPVLDRTFFPNANPAIYWSSSTNASFLNSAWRVHFSTGGVGYTGKVGTGNVRCVRAEQAGAVAQPDAYAEVICPSSVNPNTALSVGVKIHNRTCGEALTFTKADALLIGNTDNTLSGVGVYGPNRTVINLTAPAAVCPAEGISGQISLPIVTAVNASLAGKAAQVMVDVMTADGQVVASGACMVPVQ